MLPLGSAAAGLRVAEHPPVWVSSGTLVLGSLRGGHLGWVSVLGGCLVPHTVLWDPRKTLEACFPIDRSCPGAHELLGVDPTAP